MNFETPKRLSIIEYHLNENSVVSLINSKTPIRDLPFALLKRMCIFCILDFRIRYYNFRNENASNMKKSPMFSNAEEPNPNKKDRRKSIELRTSGTFIYLKYKKLSMNSPETTRDDQRKFLYQAIEKGIIVFRPGKNTIFCQ